MSASFEEFYQNLQELVKSYSNKDVMIKLDADLEANIVRLFGQNLSSLAKAKKGLEDVSELAYTTAEHHPYWNLLYNACQISKITLEKWHSSLTKEELDEISWSIDELKNTYEKLRQNQHPHAD
jgi:deoxyadenosine/deoxycytidine kinase